MMPQTVSKQQRDALKEALRRGDQAKLAREFGVSRATISQWLKFGSCLSAEKAAAVRRRANQLIKINGINDSLTGRKQNSSPVSLRETP